jgi:DNA repair protein RecO (recombination protein O)
MKYRDTSKIVTFYSKKFGKVKGIAKGAREAKNKFGSSLEPMTHSMLLIYKKEHKDLHLISQCDAINSYINISNDLDRMTTALSVIELVNRATHDEERNEQLFTLLVETLSAFNAGLDNYGTYLQAFRLRLAGLFGYMPNFDTCNKCGKSIQLENNEKPVAFQISRGAIFCNQCYDLNASASRYQDEKAVFTSFSIQGLQIAQKLLNAQWSTLNNLKFDGSVGNEIDELVRLYLRHHLDGLKTLKTLELFNVITK